MTDLQVNESEEIVYRFIHRHAAEIVSKRGVEAQRISDFYTLKSPHRFPPAVSP